MERANSQLQIPQFLQIPEARLEFGEHISSEGSSGTVFKGVWTRDDGERLPVAIKCIKCRGEIGSPQYNSTIRLFEQEVEVFNSSTGCGDRVCQMYGVSELSDGETLCCVMKLYGQSLADLLEEKNHNPFSLNKVYKYSVECLEALVALHNNGVIMQDLKPSNVLLDEDGKAVVSDFDMAHDVGTRNGVAHVNGSLGTPAYQSPEAWDPNSFGGVTVKTDIWAFACVVVELATGREPWPDMRWPAIRKAILSNCETPEIPNSLPQDMQVILRRCFDICPEKRPHAEEVLAEFIRMRAK
jgi:serine/threonine protein kinase